MAVRDNGVQGGFIPVASFRSLMAEARISPHFVEEGKRLGTQKLSPQSCPTAGYKARQTWTLDPP